MNLPRNVIRFEILLYASLMLDSLSVAVQDRTPTAVLNERVIMANTLLAGGMILLLLYFVWLAARQRKNWPRMVLGAVLVLSVIFLLLAIGEQGLGLGNMIEIVSCALTTAGLYYSYTGDAQGWFNA